MASHNYHQEPSAPLMYPENGSNIRPVPPVRSEYMRNAQEESLLPPRPPDRMDINPTRPSNDTGLRRDDQEETNGDVNVENTCNFNTYATKKTIALGLMEIALIASNAMQLRTLILQKQRDGFWIASLILVCVSVLFQFGLAFLLYLMIKDDIRNAAKEGKLKHLNDFALALVVFVTIINLVINIFMLTTDTKSFLDTNSLEILHQAQKLK
ncbi:hypothetical protein I4U23_009327 [Adineta vaga]|nr:hypothetical protein I4U23_009327 [Adineta vaga]